MRFEEAKRIMKDGPNKFGYRVSFEWKEEIILRIDCFPDHDEPPIETERGAWQLARKFASKTKGKCVNIYVTRAGDHCPVEGYQTHMIKNRWGTDDR